MPREKNPLSPIQTNKKEFAIVCKQIRRFTPDKLSELGPVSRVSIYKWMKPQGVNPKIEEAIIKTLKLAVSNQRAASKALSAQILELAD